MPGEGSSERSERAQGSEAPVGRGEYVVGENECLHSIAYAHGLFWETIWNLPENAELKRIRKDPSVLRPGDRVTVPELRLKQEDGGTELTHKFRRKGVPLRFRVCLLDDGQPRANLDYVLDVDGVLIRGATDENGWIDQPISPSASALKVKVEGEEDIEFRFGGVDPVDTIAGVQTRLVNLGYECGPTTGRMTPETRTAVMEFQRDQGLEETGEPDADFQDALKRAHGS